MYGTYQRQTSISRKIRRVRSSLSPYPSPRLSHFLLLGLHVARHEELREQHQQREDVHEVHLRDDLGRLGAVGGEEVRGLRHHADELNHLLHGEDGLPPDGHGGAGGSILGELIGLRWRAKEEV